MTPPFDVVDGIYFVRTGFRNPAREIVEGTPVSGCRDIGVGGRTRAESRCDVHAGDARSWSDEVATV